MKRDNCLIIRSEGIATVVVTANIMENMLDNPDFDSEGYLIETFRQLLRKSMKGNKSEN